MNTYNNQRKYPKRGEIWICDLGTNKGSEQNGVRPCLVINQKVRYEQTCIVLPASRTMRTSTYTIGSYHFLLHQIRAVDTQRLSRRISRVSKASVSNIIIKLCNLLNAYI